MWALVGLTLNTEWDAKIHPEALPGQIENVQTT